MDMPPHPTSVQHYQKYHSVAAVIVVVVVVAVAVVVVVVQPRPDLTADVQNASIYTSTTTITATITTMGVFPLKFLRGSFPPNSRKTRQAPQTSTVIGNRKRISLSPADYRVWGSVVSSPSRFQGGAQAKNEFGAFYASQNTSGCRILKYAKNAELMSKEDIVKILRTRRLSYFGHVARMNPNRYPHILLHGHISGVRPRGRPRKDGRTT